MCSRATVPNENLKRTLVTRYRSIQGSNFAPRLGRLGFRNEIQGTKVNGAGGLFRFERSQRSLAPGVPRVWQRR